MIPLTPFELVMVKSLIREEDIQNRIDQLRVEADNAWAKGDREKSMKMHDSARAYMDLMVKFFPPAPNQPPRSAP